MGTRDNAVVAARPDGLQEGGVIGVASIQYQGVRPACTGQPLVPRVRYTVIRFADPLIDDIACLLDLGDGIIGGSAFANNPLAALICLSTQGRDRPLHQRTRVESSGNY